MYDNWNEGKIADESPIDLSDLVLAGSNAPTLANNSADSWRTG